MTRAAALDTLKQAEAALRAQGVRRAAMFGSVARGDARPDSDLDIMIEIDTEAHLTIKSPRRRPPTHTTRSDTNGPTLDPSS